MASYVAAQLAAAAGWDAKAMVHLEGKWRRALDEDTSVVQDLLAELSRGGVTTLGPESRIELQDCVWEQRPSLRVKLGDAHLRTGVLLLGPSFPHLLQMWEDGELR